MNEMDAPKNLGEHLHPAFQVPLEMGERVSHVVDSARQVAHLVQKLNQFDQNGQSFGKSRPPLVLVAPYHDPHRSNHELKDKIKSTPEEIRPIAESYIAAYRHEQDSNDYQFYMDDQDKAMAAPAGRADLIPFSSWLEKHHNPVSVD